MLGATTFPLCMLYIGTVNEIVERAQSKLKFHTGIREHFTRGDGRDTNEYRLNPHPAADSNISEARTRGT